MKQSNVDDVVRRKMEEMRSICEKETQQSRGNDGVRRQMEAMRLICEREIPIEQQRIDATKASSQNSLDSCTTKSHQTIQFQASLGKLKAELREMEDALVKALAVKTRREAKRMGMMDSLSVTRARTEELKGIVEDQRARKDEYASIITEQSKALKAREEKYNQNVEHREETEEAISWYNKVLGFRIECGHGVKFIFTNINSKNPDEEYSFTVRHENDLYTLLHCDPNLNDTKELVNELNKNNGLFKFVRIMREKFQEVAACGTYPQATFDNQDTMSISVSAPDSSVSSAKQVQLPPNESNRRTKKANHGKAGRQEVLSPGSALASRRSPRFKVKK